MSIHWSARRPAIVAVCATVLVLLFAAPASAHTKLLRSSPAKNARVSAPAEIELVFSESLRAPLVKVRVQDAAGQQHTGHLTVRGATVTAQVTGALAPGPASIAYRVVSADGHPVAGEVRFTVTGSSGVAPPPTPSETPQAIADKPARENDGGARWAWIGAGLAALLAVGAGAYWVRARNRA